MPSGRSDARPRRRPPTAAQSVHSRGRPFLVRSPGGRSVRVGADRLGVADHLGVLLPGRPGVRRRDRDARLATAVRPRPRAGAAGGAFETVPHPAHAGLGTGEEKPGVAEKTMLPRGSGQRWRRGEGRSADGRWLRGRRGARLSGVSSVSAYGAPDEGRPTRSEVRSADHRAGRPKKNGPAKSAGPPDGFGLDSRQPSSRSAMARSMAAIRRLLSCLSSWTSPMIWLYSSTVTPSRSSIASTICSDASCCTA